MFIVTAFGFKTFGLARVLKHPLNYQLPFTILQLLAFDALTMTFLGFGFIRRIGGAGRLLRRRH